MFIRCSHGHVIFFTWCSPWSCCHNVNQVVIMIMLSYWAPDAHNGHVITVFARCSQLSCLHIVHHLFTMARSSQCSPLAYHKHVIKLFTKCSTLSCHHNVYQMLTIVMSSRCLPTAQHSLSLKCSPSAHHVMSYQCLPGFHHGSYHCVRGVHCHFITMLIKYSSQSCYQVLTTVMLSSAHNGHVITVHQVFTTGI